MKSPYLVDIHPYGGSVQTCGGQIATDASVLAMTRGTEDEGKEKLWKKQI